MVTLTPTPAPAAGLTKTDIRDPRLRTRTAIGIIAAGYLLFFGVGGINAIYVAVNDIVLKATDYSSFAGIAEASRRLVGIGGAVLILYLVCRWLDIHRDLAGVPRYPAAPQPALMTAAIAILGTVLAALVLDWLRPGPEADPNAAVGGVESNPRALLSLVSDLNASRSQRPERSVWSKATNAHLVTKVDAPAKCGDRMWQAFEEWIVVRAGRQRRKATLRAFTSSHHRRAASKADAKRLSCRLRQRIPGTNSMDD